jgi:hypothetical protein
LARPQNWQAGRQQRDSQKSQRHQQEYAWIRPRRMIDETFYVRIHSRSLIEDAENQVSLA